MGITATSMRKAGVGWPNPGWGPPSGYAGESITGASVSYDSSMTVGAFHAGVRLIAEDIASLPLFVYRRLKPQGREKATSHPAYRLLHDEPNPEMTAMVWEETEVGHVLTWGNCYSEKEFDAAGQVIRLWPLRPDRMAVDRYAGTDRRRYKYRLPDGTIVELPARNVFHVPGFGFDGLVGYSRISMARRAIESAIVLEEYGLRTFANNAEPGVTLKHPGKLSKPAKVELAEAWDKAHRGLSNAQRTAVLEEGMSIEKMGFPPEDAQFLDSRRFSVEEIARWLRLSPHKLSDHSRSTFNNIEEMSIDHVVGTLRPIAVRFEQQINKDILAGDPGYYAEHLLDALLRGKTLERAQANQIRRLNGVLNADEWREQDNINPLPDGQGQTYIVPSNMSPLDMLADAIAARMTPPAQGAP
jgi:HK97 family phage portal protein